MCWCNAVSLCGLSSPHSLRVLGRKLESNSGTEPTPLPLTSDVAPVESKVALQLTALQGVDYCSTASTANPSQYQEGDCCHTVHHTSTDTLILLCVLYKSLIDIETLSLTVHATNAGADPELLLGGGTNP